MNPRTHPVIRKRLGMTAGTGFAPRAEHGDIGCGTNGESYQRRRRPKAHVAEIPWPCPAGPEPLISVDARRECTDDMADRSDRRIRSPMTTIQY